MMYQALASLSLLALMLVYHQSLRRSRDGGSYSFLALYTCVVIYILSGFYPSTDLSVHSPYASIARSTELLSFVMLFPLLFVNIKRFTNLSLPQWRAVRAFSLGVPLLIGIDGVVDSLQNPTGGGTASFPPYLWVAYCYGLFSVLVAAWRFTSTPRQRTPIVLAMLAPIAIIGADAGCRLDGWLLLQHNPALSITFICVVALSLLVRLGRQFAVRPVARSALIDQVQDALLVFDSNRRIIDFNSAAAVWLNATTQALIGSRARRWLPSALYTELCADPSLNLVFPWDKNGKEYWFEIRSTPLIVDKKPSGYFLTLRDITDRRLTEIALSESREQLERANAQLKVLANTDSLTGLYNRRRLMESLAAEIERHSRSGLTLGLLILDLDHFKQINDQFGHPLGDDVLKQTATCMRETVRESDVLGRIGGEEFAVIAVDAESEGPFVLAERLRKNLSALEILVGNGQRVSVSASIGCVRYTGGMIDTDTLVKVADEALYTSKREGRNRVTNRDCAPSSNRGHGFEVRRLA